MPYWIPSAMAQMIELVITHEADRNAAHEILYCLAHLDGGWACVIPLRRPTSKTVVAE